MALVLGSGLRMRGSCSFGSEQSAAILLVFEVVDVKHRHLFVYGCESSSGPRRSGCAGCLSNWVCDGVCWILIWKY